MQVYVMIVPIPISKVNTDPIRFAMKKQQKKRRKENDLCNLRTLH